MAKPNIYLPNGYLNIKKILGYNLPFTFIIGGRGTGKTYGMLKTVLEEHIKFMFMRRTQTQADLINKPEFSPFKIINRDTGSHIGSVPLTKYNSGFYHQQECDDGIFRPYGEPIGYTCALSTVSNIRGFDASDVKLIIYDEFIPEKHERPIKNEGAALLNAYETMNRNRELNGEPPIQLVCLANSNDVANAIFLELGLVEKALRMKQKGQEVLLMRERGLCLINLEESIISDKKRATALYRLSGNSTFAKMALDNDFSDEEIGRINKRKLTELRPLVNVGEITIYEHKSEHLYYVTTHKSGVPKTYSSGKNDLKRFKKSYLHLWRAYMEYDVEFEEYLCEVLFNKYFE